MHHLFISYSRRDQPFVRRLSQALTEAGRTTWVDWEGIAPTTTFMAEIHRAIAAADSFVFVISPDSCASVVCRLEIEHAAAHHKRLIPVVCRATPTPDVPPELAPLNWISFEDAPFADAVSLLNTAVDTDLEWVRAHTDLLVRAAAWDRRTRSGLLRGVELATAEQRLVEAATGKQPPPTSLQQEFVVASRRNATRVLRVVIGAVSAALAVTAVLAVVAFTMSRLAEARRQQADEQRALAETRRQEAQTQQQLAEERARIANSQRLASDARAPLSVQLDLGMLLSVEAYRTNATPEAGNTLLQALQQSPYLRRYLHGHTGAVYSVAFHPNGRLMASGGANEIIVWDLPTSAALKIIPGPWGARRLMFSPDGTILGGDTRLIYTRSYFWDTRSWSRIGGEIAGAFEGFTTKGRAQVVERDGVMRTIDLRQPRRVTDGVLRFPDTFATQKFAVDRSGTTAAATTLTRGIEFWSIATGRRLAEPEGVPSTNATAMIFDPKGRFLASGEFGGKIDFWDVSTGKPSGKAIEALDGQVRGLAISEDGVVIASSGGDSLVRLWSVETREAIGVPLVAHRATVNGVAFSRDGMTLASASDDGEIILWDVIVPQPARQALGGYRILSGVDRFATAQPPSAEPAPDPDNGLAAMELLLLSSANAVRFDAEGTVLAAATWTGSLLVWNVTQARTLLRLEKVFSLVTGFALSPDGRMLAVGGSAPEHDDRHPSATEKVEIIETATGKRRMAALRGGQFFGEALAFSPDGKLLVLAGYNELQFVDLDSRKVAAVVKDSGVSHVVTIQFDPGGRRMVIAGDVAGRTSPITVLWDAIERRQLRVLSRDRATRAAAFSPDGRVLATVSGDGEVLVQDASTFEPLAAPFGSGEGSAGVLQFSRDGKLLVNGAGRGAQIWDVQNRRKIGAPLAAPVFSIGRATGIDLIGALTFSSDGRALVAAYRFSQSVAKWTIDPQVWVERICAVANRNLTAVEWKQYVGPESYSETCPRLPKGGGARERR